MGPSVPAVLAAENPPRVVVEEDTIGVESIPDGREW